jgi:membrane protein
MLRLNTLPHGHQLPRDGSDSGAGSPSRWAHPLLQSLLRLPAWMVRGYRQSDAGDQAAAVAFHALMAIVPTFLLLVFVAGLFLQRDQVLVTALYTSSWGLPPSDAREAFGAALAARDNSGWFGVLSLVGFAWIGTGFVGSLSRSMNRIYGVTGCGYFCEKQRAFVVVILFAGLFLLALITSTVPTLFVAKELPLYFQEWMLASGVYQVVGYLVAITASVVLFLVVYRVIPNAGQGLPDVWAGTAVAALLFVGMAQVFPIYVRLIGGVNRYGAAFGLVSLLVAWLYVLAHVLLFGTYINASYQHRRRRRAGAGSR